MHTPPLPALPPHTTTAPPHHHCPHCHPAHHMQLAGDGFADQPELRRRALDLTFCALLRERAEAARQAARLQALAAAAGVHYLHILRSSSSSSVDSPPHSMFLLLLPCAAASCA